MHVHLARIGDGGAHGVLRDLVEGDAMHRLVPRRRGRLDDVPGNRLALAVGVGGEIDGARALDGGLQLLDRVGLIVRDDIGGREIVLDIDADAPIRQVADVAHRGAHGVAGAEILGDRLRLRGRLDDHEPRPFRDRLHRVLAPRRAACATAATAAVLVGARRVVVVTFASAVADFVVVRLVGFLAGAFAAVDARVRVVFAGAFVSIFSSGICAPPVYVHIVPVSE